jgi:hypothetical protein
VDGQKLTRTTVILMIGSLLMGPAVAHSATPTKMNGTWASLAEIPPNDMLGNTVAIVLFQLDTFSTSGTVVTSSGAPVLAIATDQGSFVGTVGIGQGSWKYRSGRFSSTQWHFINNVTTGQLVGYMKTIAEWSLANKKTAAGSYRVEMLQLDMTTPFTSGGSPAAVSGSFQMRRMPVERLD